MHIVRSTLHFARVNWRHRKLVRDFVHRDFKLRYLGSLLGSYWNFVHPLAMILIYTAIFSQLMHSRLGDAGDTFGPFAFTVYLCAGLLPWNAFTEMVSRATGVFHEQAALIRKISFPMELLQTVVCGSSLITFSIAMTIYLGLLLFAGPPVSWTWVLVPLVFFFQLLFGLGLSMFLGVFNVFFRDVQQVIGIVFQVWFWLTPIVYLQKSVPEKYHLAFLLNPFFYFIDLYQHIFFFQESFPWANLLIAGGIGTVTFALGCVFFSRVKNDLIDEI